MKKHFGEAMLKLLLLQVYIKHFILFKQYMCQFWKAETRLQHLQSPLHLFAWRQYFFYNLWQGKEGNFLEDLRLVPLVVFREAKVCYTLLFSISCYTISSYNRFLIYLQFLTLTGLLFFNRNATKGWLHSNRYAHRYCRRYLIHSLLLTGY